MKYQLQKLYPKEPFYGLTLTRSKEYKTNGSYLKGIQITLALGSWCYAFYIRKVIK